MVYVGNWWRKEGNYHCIKYCCMTADEENRSESPVKK